MVDLGMAKFYREKLNNDTFANEDIPGYVELVCSIGNEYPDMAKEVSDWDKVTQVLVMETDLACWIQTQGGKYSWGMGENPSPNLTFKIRPGVANDIISGKLDANKAYVSGDLVLLGDPIDGARFRTMRELALDILNDMKIPDDVVATPAKAAPAPAAAAEAAEQPAGKAPAKKAAKKGAKKAAGKKAAKKAAKKKAKKAAQK